MNCPKCSYELFKDFKFCYECGTIIINENIDKKLNCRNANNWSKLKCSECGSALYSGAKFCHNCGKDVIVNVKPKSKELLGWVCVVLAFVAPWGTLISFILSIILLTRKDQNRTLSLVGLIFSSAVIIFIIMPLFSFFF